MKRPAPPLVGTAGLDLVAGARNRRDRHLIEVWIQSGSFRCCGSTRRVRDRLPCFLQYQIDDAAQQGFTSPSLRIGRGERAASPLPGSDGIGAFSNEKVSLERAERALSAELGVDK